MITLCGQNILALAEKTKTRQELVKKTLSFNIFIIKGINVITIHYRYIGFRVLLLIKL